MKRYLLATVLMALGGVGAAQAGPIILASNTFDSGNQGWTSYSFGYQQSSTQPDFTIPSGGAGFVVYNPTGGNPGGYLSLSDPDSGNEYFVAGADFHGDFSAAYGGFFNFDQIRLDGEELTPDLPYSPILALTNGNMVVVYSNQDPVPTGSWNSYAIPLTANNPGWFVGSINGTAATSADLYSVLSSIQGAFIGADWYIGTDVYGLDNVSISNTPEPATFWMLLPTLLLLAYAGRRTPTLQRVAVLVQRKTR